MVKAGIEFQSSLPSQGATYTVKDFCPECIISILAPLTGSDPDLPEGIASVLDISIHAPLTGSDVYDKQAEQCVSYISIHAPLTGSDRRHTATSTSYRHFNPRSPHRERQKVGAVMADIDISIHAPLTGSDRYQPL